MVAMAPVVRIKPNGCQSLLAHDDAIDDLKAHSWDIFLRKFDGYNLVVAQAFAQTFDGFRAKVRVCAIGGHRRLCRPRNKTPTGR
jgi:hypothetical protein